ncbi:Choline transport protein [Lasiodiplodia hormozganensis]|uniref:Choline transport protein n=1 Tax=Lasiodiplodia hormozganensis TaxID=869390 RepID=A0AA40CHC1_9PEZI|nr:Choline transport protein [Lasiodiplodia hormozganensis]
MAAPYEHSNGDGLQRKISLTGKGADKSSLPEDAVGSADAVLEAMGYAPELSRNRSTMQVAFMSFVLAAIPYGLATTMYYPLVGGGPANIVWGWVGVSFIILCVAASLGEITSVYPTAGGVYYQTFMLAPPSYRRLASWTCGWLYVVGNITITLAVNFGTTLFFISCINIFETEPGVGIWEATTWQTFLTFLAITFLANATSSLGNRYLPYIDTAAIYWTFAGVLAIIITVLARAKGGRRSAEWVFGDFEPQSGWPAGWSFCVGLLQAAYATSSTGMIISMCEEVQHPATQVPKAMVGTIVLNTFAGLLFLLPLLFVMPDLTELINLASGQPVPAIIKAAVGNDVGAFILTIPLFILALICGIGCTTATSRCTWAFARDGAIPGAKWWKTVNHKMDVPFNAMMLSMVVQIILGVIYFGSTAAFNAFSGVGVICLTASYAVPIAVSLAGGRTHIAEGSFHLGKLGVFCNIVSLCWSLLAIPLFCMPTTIPVAAETMNYASVVFFAFVMLSLGWYVVWGHRNYQGPPTVD